MQRYKYCVYIGITFTAFLVIGLGTVCLKYPHHTITRHGIHRGEEQKEGTVLKALLDAPYNAGKAPKHSEPVVPRIVHYVWPNSTNRPNFRFHHLISVLASYRHIRPREIWFWYEGHEPEGEFWQEAKTKVPIMKLVRKTFPRQIFGRKVNVEEHVTDIVRMEAILKYGGIYMDLDVVPVKSFDPLLMYDVTLGYELPTGLCNGVIIAKPNATFMRIWYDKYRDFDDSQWAQHSVILPATLAKEHPTLIHTETDSLHSPGWSDRQSHMFGDKAWDWSNNFAIHMYYRFYNKDHNPDDIKELRSPATLGRLFRFIYYGHEGTLTTWNNLFKSDEKKAEQKEGSGMKDEVTNAQQSKGKAEKIPKS